MRKNPRKDAARIFTKSPRSTFSAGPNNERSQKKALAAKDLIVKMANGEIPLEVVRSLHTTMFMPKMAYAVKQAACPVRVELDFILLPDSYSWQ